MFTFMNIQRYIIIRLSLIELILHIIWQLRFHQDKIYYLNNVQDYSVLYNNTDHPIIYEGSQV